MGWGIQEVTPNECRIRCGPYAYMQKVYEGNSVTKGGDPEITMIPINVPGPTQQHPNSTGKKRYLECFFYKWFCSRVYVAKECIVHDWKDSPPPNVTDKIIFPDDPTGELYKCHKTWRWGRDSRNLGNKEIDFESEYEFPKYIHCFRYSPEKRYTDPQDPSKNSPPFPSTELWEAGLPKNFPPGNEEVQPPFAKTAPWYYFSPFVPNPEEDATCFRNPKEDENLNEIVEKLNACANGLFDSPKTCTLLFYYEAWGGHKAFRRTGSQGNQYGEPRPDDNFISGTPIPPIKTQSESERDYWLTVFAM